MSDRYLIVGPDGVPCAVADLAAFQSAAIILAYAVGASKDDDEVDRVLLEWMHSVGSVDEIGYITAAAVPLMAKCIIRPLLEVIDELAPEVSMRLRDKLIESRDYARETLGGDAA